MTGHEPLPVAVPVFPLSGALLLPRGILPLNIFEPRYLAMVRDAMAATGAANRIIGIIQPRTEGEPPPLYAVGCLGRIGDYRETEDGRVLVALTGVSRFRIAAELDRTTLYRQVMADYHDFTEDRDEPDALAAVARAGLEDVLRTYLDTQGLSADWEAVHSADDESLVTTLASICPFDPAEKQALLEADDLADRAATLTALMTFAQGPSGEGDRPTLQ
ncbi:ATP-dependent protease [Polymorphobacter glacialis]|uniref:ATP-dependent protease n=1 Tax=Sandarakinorhabdus glacialis TaxID=1614636 RepID=A0A916ZR73_9SPHN|nr:LON peptidase substrate-binding domain-containing protein [Polymorphobacter glacialis]GGE08986.1 ATP-dependent protease [Polymorphobacter glacialis]